MWIKRENKAITIYRLKEFEYWHSCCSPLIRNGPDHKMEKRRRSLKLVEIFVCPLVVDKFIANFLSYNNFFYLYDIRNCLLFHPAPISFPVVDLSKRSVMPLDYLA